MVKPNLLVSENSLVIARSLKKQSKGLELIIDLIILGVNLLWTFYSYINNGSEMKIFSMINLGAQLIGKALIHFTFYNCLRKNKLSKSLKIFGYLMITLYLISLVFYFLIIFLGYNSEFISIQSLFSNKIGQLMLLGGAIFSITEILDKIMYTFADGMIEKEVQNDDE